MVVNFMKKRTTLVIREMQIKTSVRYHLTPVRMDFIRKTKDKTARKDVEKREPLHTADRNVN